MLMCFPRQEVDNEQTISMTAEDFGLPQSLQTGKKWRTRLKNPETCPTAAGLENSEGTSCFFCSGRQVTSSCIKAQKMFFDGKINALFEKGLVFNVLILVSANRRITFFIKCQYKDYE